MEAKTPEMQEYLAGMNRDLLDKIEANKLAVTKQYEAIKEQHERDSYVTLINGDRRTVKNNVAIAEMHDDIKTTKVVIEEIKISTEILREVTKWNAFNKKFKIYWFAGILLTAFFSHSIWQPILLKLLEK